MTDVPHVGDDQLLRRLLQAACMTTYEPFFTHEQWQKLPLKFQQQWWRETDFGKRPPSQDLIAQCKLIIQIAEAKDKSNGG